jgi:hypothetical protein
MTKKDFVKLLLESSQKQLARLRAFFEKLHDLEARIAESFRGAKCPQCADGIMYPANTMRKTNLLGLPIHCLVRFAYKCRTCHKRVMLPSMLYAYKIPGQLLALIAIPFHQDNCGHDRDMQVMMDTPQTQELLLQMTLELNGNDIDYVVQKFWERFFNCSRAQAHTMQIEGIYKINAAQSQQPDIKTEDEIYHPYRLPYNLLRALSNNFQLCLKKTFEKLATLIGQITCPWEVIKDHRGGGSPFRWVGGFTKGTAINQGI